MLAVAPALQRINNTIPTGDVLIYEMYLRAYGTVTAVAPGAGAVNPMGQNKFLRSITLSSDKHRKDHRQYRRPRPLPLESVSPGRGRTADARHDGGRRGCVPGEHLAHSAAGRPGRTPAISTRCSMFSARAAKSPFSVGSRRISSPAEPRATISRPTPSRSAAGCSMARLSSRATR